MHVASELLLHKCSITYLMALISHKMMVCSPLMCLLLFFLPFPLSSSSFLPSNFTHPPTLCHPREASALLHFRNSFPIINLNYSDCSFPEYGGIANPNNTMSWDIDRDCCTWSGVTCDEVTDHVIRLDLKCSGLQGVIHSNNSIFFLTHLQSLVLSWNDFYGSEISPKFGRFSSMIHLDLSESNFSGKVPLELSDLSSLVTLDLTGNYDLRLESFILRRIVANLTSLTKLSLIFVNMSYVSPNSFTNLSTSLTSLDLRWSGLSGEFPENVFHLPSLQQLILSHNYNLTGSFPKYNWTSPLRNLSLSSTGFLIDLPYLTRSLKYLNRLGVNNCSFRGIFPSLLGNLTQITSLDLSNNNFSGQIPWSFLNLEQLIFLDLSGNSFEGQLPGICSNSTKETSLCDYSKHDQLVGPLPSNLQSLYLSGNLLNGRIPSWLYSLPSLQYLDLRQNQFCGHIGEFLYNSLVSLELGSNKLEGLIPRSIFQQVDLKYLDLSSNNLSVVVQLDQFSKLKNLRYLSLSFNNLSMESINSIMSASSNTLKSLYLSSCNITGFPYSLRSLENLESLDLSNNQIKGSVPQWLLNVGKDSLSFLNISHNLLTRIGKFPWKSLEYIDLSYNQLQGHLPNPPPSTFLFSISNNQFDGEISAQFCNLSEIEVLDLSHNSLSGNIPSCFSNFSTHLSVLDLRMNRFSGMIPPSFAKGNSLRTLNLEGNQLEGPLPHSLVKCENLEVLDVGGNKLNGSFPFWLESLPQLQILVLRANRFSGTVSRNPKVKFPFQKLRLIDLSNNEFTGLLPVKFLKNFVAMMGAHTNVLEYMGGQKGDITSYYHDSMVVVMKGFYVEFLKIQKMYITIDLSKNNFIGDIPKLIGKLNSLKGLNLSHNKLTGAIPLSLANLSNLEWLDLSSNELSGSIPRQLAADLYQLQFLDLSNNKLEGPIPQGKQFDTFNNDSYSGNEGLCGLPLSKSCSNDEVPRDEGDDDGEHNSGMIDWKVVKMGYGSGLVIGVSIGYMVLFSRSFDYWFLKRFGGRHRKTSGRFRRRRRSN